MPENNCSLNFEKLKLHIEKKIHKGVESQVQNLIKERGKISINKKLNGLTI